MKTYLLGSIILGFHFSIELSLKNNSRSGGPGDSFVGLLLFELLGMIESLVSDESSCIARWVLEVRQPSHHVKVRSDREKLAMYPSMKLMGTLIDLSGIFNHYSGSWGTRLGAQVIHALRSLAQRFSAGIPVEKQISPIYL